MKNKLVRDNIPKIILDSGRKCNLYVADEKEFFKLLKEKLLEEANEFVDSGDVNELVDVLEVLEALSNFMSVSADTLRELKLAKRATHGGFEKKIVLVS